jgi:hypothetical protein
MVITKIIKKGSNASESEEGSNLGFQNSQRGSLKRFPNPVSTQSFNACVGWIQVTQWRGKMGQTQKI